MFDSQSPVPSNFSWTTTDLGPVEKWPDLVRSTFRSLFASSLPTAIYWGEHFQLFYNDAFLPVLGTKHPAGFGQPASQIWSEIWNEIGPQFKQVALSKKGIALTDQELRLDRPGQPESAIFDYSISPILDPDGKVLGILTTAFEKTEFKRALSELERTRNQLAAAAEIAQIGFWKIELPSFDLYASDIFLKLFGFTNESHHIHSEQAFSAVHQEDVDRIRKAVERAIVDHTPYSEDYRTVWPNGEIRWIEGKGAAIYNVENVPTSFTGTVLDITDRMRSREALQLAKQDAERANDLKSSFLANMSHEIRTPLGAMIGFASLLADPSASTAERANYVEILQRNGNQLHHVINDILDLSKVETGHINFEFLIVDPRRVAHEVVSLMNVVAREKSLALNFVDDGTTPDTVISDPTRVRQVLMNLVSNAIKFTKVGSITISLSGFNGVNGERCCAFEVVDTGLGIPADSVDRLFKLFSQADNSMTRRFGGTGLGLALSRALARGMGGDVRLVNSQQDIGSTFHFAIESREDLRPSAEVKELTITREQNQPLEKNALEGIYVLVVEDSADNQQLIWRYLSKYGARVELADNGLDGLMRALATEHDIVLMDLQMPVMDGYTAVGKLRSRGYRTPIIALTAHAMADVKKKCEDVGCNAHLPKPINSRELIETIRQLTHRPISII